MSKLNKEEKNVIFNAPSSLPKRKQDELKINGWGYKDAQFIVTDDKNISFKGPRYGLIDGEVLPNFKEWMKKLIGIDISQNITDYPSITKFDDSLILNNVSNDQMINELEHHKFDISTDAVDRIFRAHGHTLSEIYTLRKSKFERVPDVVVWVRSHKEVVKLVELCKVHNCVLIPFGGGTSVTGALLCSEKEKRLIISLDTSQMNKILWVDDANLTARFESGIIGQDMDRRLAKLGYCVGHEPDSNEFSSLGGWVATRASGMKKNTYGNIEDMLIHVTFVTPEGVMQREYQSPRVSNGPDLHHFIMGSEGTFGVVTEVTLKIRKLPALKKYASIVFPDFDSGFRCLREIARQKLFPASIRLMDNEQFHFGMALKIVTPSLLARFVDSLKKIYLLSYKGFDASKMCVATILMEGETKKEIVEFEKRLMRVAADYNGLSGGEENGRRGYLLTFVIAYIRDLAMDNCVVAESFETSVPWDRTLDMCTAVKQAVVRQAVELGVRKPVFITCRITQLYDSGVCVYFYLALNYDKMEEGKDPIHVYEQVETTARNVILDYGGSLSHHHGVGVVRKHWLPRVISPAGMLALSAVKKSLDPSNIFANSSIFPDDDATLHASL